MIKSAIKTLILIAILAIPSLSKAQKSNGTHVRTEEEGRKHLDELLSSYKTAKEFDQRKKDLRTCILQALGINKLDYKGALNPIITHKVEMEGYTVENVAFESMPGHFVFGNLYKPTKTQGHIPVILSPHGHWGDDLRNSIHQVGTGGRVNADLQYRCAALAKMGAMVFSYDMYSWGESVLQTGDLSHHETGFASAIQTWNSMRALDYVLSLPNVDPKRVGITGESGGGTQSFLLAALDDRVTASAPIVMVSSSFYGGCPCESGLPIHNNCAGYETNNAEIAAMFAPRPQLVVGIGNDWTRTIPTIDYPYLQKVYALYGMEKKVSSAFLPDEQHDYGYSKRVPMYQFFANHFKLNLKAISGKDGKIEDQKIKVQPIKDLLVFGAASKLPAHALKSNTEIVNMFNKIQGN